MRTGVVMYAGITAHELVDLKCLPRNASGPFVISDDTRSVCYGSHMPSSSIQLCRVIIANNLHRNLNLFRKFYTVVYCFPDPKPMIQVPPFHSIMYLERFTA